MKKRKFTKFAVFVAIFYSYGMMNCFSQDGTVVVEDTAFEIQARPPAAFLHDTHNEKAGIDDCITCHHVYEDGQITDDSSEDMECSFCHLKRANHNKMALIKAYHSRCKGCHLKLKNGPFLCGECHIKQQ